MDIVREELHRMRRELGERPLDATSIERLKEHARRSAVGARLAVSIAAREREIVEEAVNEIFARWATEIAKYPLAREKTTRDMSLVLRYCLYSEILDDPQWVHDRLSAWFRTILNAYAVNKDMVSDGYDRMRIAIRRRLPPEEAEPIAETVDAVRRVLAS